MSVTAVRTLDVGICLAILTDKRIFDAVSEDGAGFESIKVDVVRDYWVALVADDKTIGVAQFKPMFNKCYDSHIHILPEFRKEYSLECGKALIEWCEENIGDCLLFTTIPEFCPNVVRFLKTFDFEDVGRLKGAWKKNGKQNDMTILTRGIESCQQ